MQPLAPPAPQVAPSLFNPIASNYQPEASTESQYYFQPLTGSLPLDFLNGSTEGYGDDDELDNLVAGWAANAADLNVDVDQLNANWDAQETANPMTVYGQGQIMDAIKMEWNNTILGGDGSVNYLGQSDYDPNFSFASFGTMDLPSGPPLAGNLPLSPVEGQGDVPLPATQFPAWINRPTPSAAPAADNNPLPSPFNAPGTASAFALSVDPSTMNWASGDYVNYDDVPTTSTSKVAGAPLQQQQAQGSMLPQQGQERAAGAYGPV